MKRFTRLTGLWVMVLGLGLTIGGFDSADAQSKGKKQLSDKAVKLIMRYTWAIMPKKIKTGDGKTIAINAKKPDMIKVPLNDARRVIKVGRLSAHAQICDLREHQTNNYRTMMKREQESNNWSTLQLVYINQLHLFTVMWLTGSVTVVEEGEDARTKAAEAAKKRKKPTCNDEQRANVKRKIEAYINGAQN